MLTPRSDDWVISWSRLISGGRVQGQVDELCFLIGLFTFLLRRMFGGRSWMTLLDLWLWLFITEFFWMEFVRRCETDMFLERLIFLFGA